MPAPKVSLSKQANPLLRGPAAKTVQMALQKMLGGLKTYGKRLTGDSTLKPLVAKKNLLDDLADTLRQTTKPLVDVGPLDKKYNLVKDMMEEVSAKSPGWESRNPLPNFQQVFDDSMAGIKAKLKQHKGLFPGKLTESTSRTQNAALRRAQAAAAAKTDQLRKQIDMANRVGGLNDTLHYQWIQAGKKVNDATRSNKMNRLAFGGDGVPGLGQMGEVSKGQAAAQQAIQQELDAISKTRRYTGGAAAGATLGGIGTAAYNNSKQSAALPEPTSRGQTKKVTVPESSSQEPDLDPEGVQMTEQDHNIHKEARFGSLLKLLAKGVYKTPRSLKALTVGGGGGYAAGRQHGHQVGLEDGREDAAKTLTDLFQKKQAFMGAGALAGMATAPSKEEEDLSIGRGALRGVGTGLGVGTGAITGGALGGLGGAGLGALLGALSRSKHEMRMGGGRAMEFYTPLGARMSAGAATGAGMGMLAGGLAGGAYGGYKGNKATKALLDKTAPISDKKKDKKDDDKDVKEAAAALQAVLQRNRSR